MLWRVSVAKRSENNCRSSGQFWRIEGATRHRNLISRRILMSKHAGTKSSSPKVTRSVQERELCGASRLLETHNEASCLLRSSLWGIRRTSKLNRTDIVVNQWSKTIHIDWPLKSFSVDFLEKTTRNNFNTLTQHVLARLLRTSSRRETGADSHNPSH